MEGAQFRDSRMLRFAVAVACAVLAALVVAPLAGAQSPAGDQYGSPLPSSGGDGGSTSSGTTPPSSSSGSGTVIPVAPSTDTSTTDSSPTGSSDTGSSEGSGGASHGKQGADHKAKPDKPNPENLTSTQPASSHTIPQIAANSAGDSWVPFFIIGLVALASAFAAAVILRNRRRRTAG